MEKRQLLLLFTVVLEVIGVTLWGRIAYRVPTDLPRDGYLEKEMREDFNLCNDMYTEYNATSHHYETLKNRLQILQEYIPANYSGNFKNPCLYDFHQKPINPAVSTSHPCKVSLRIWSKHVKANVFRQNKGSVKTHLYCLPAFFLSGFPKCATTTLYGLITQHPLVAKNMCKENFFWNTFIDEKGTDRDKKMHLLWYFYRLSQSIQYIESNPLSITLDASPIYTLSFTENFCMLPTLLKRVLPEAKFILIMRNPSERYFSHYWYRRRGVVTKEGINSKFIQYAHSAKGMKDFHHYTVDTIKYFQSCVDSGKSVLYCIINERRSKISDLLYYGLYYYHIGPWLKIIPRNRFVFLRTEDLADNPSLIMSKVWHFLHLDDIVNERVLANVDQEVRDVQIPRQTKVLLDEFYQPHNRLLAHLLSDAKYLWDDQAADGMDQYTFAKIHR